MSERPPGSGTHGCVESTTRRSGACEVLSAEDTELGSRCLGEVPAGRHGRTVLTRLNCLSSGLTVPAEPVVTVPCHARSRFAFERERNRVVRATGSGVNVEPVIITFNRGQVVSFRVGQ